MKTFILKFDFSVFSRSSCPAIPRSRLFFFPCPSASLLKQSVTRFSSGDPAILGSTIKKYCVESHCFFKDIMTPAEKLICVTDQHSVNGCKKLMAKHRIRHLLLKESNREYIHFILVLKDKVRFN